MYTTVYVHAHTDMYIYSKLETPQHFVNLQPNKYAYMHTHDCKKIMHMTGEYCHMMGSNNTHDRK